MGSGRVSMFHGNDQEVVATVNQVADCINNQHRLIRQKYGFNFNYQLIAYLGSKEMHAVKRIEASYMMPANDPASNDVTFLAAKIIQTREREYLHVTTSELLIE